MYPKLKGDRKQSCKHDMMPAEPNNHLSIAVLVCYMGPFPWYFDYFIHSCTYNKSVDFIIISDTDYDKPLSSNIRIVRSTLEEVNKLATSKFGFDTHLETPYKLCDFKPAYGLIFSDLIAGYDFWAFADIDVIFGNIREFITPAMMHQYELISVRHDFLPGQFLLFRNNEKMNRLFTLSRDYRKVFESDKHYCYDETNFQWPQFTDGVHYSLIESEIESMTHLVKRLEEENYIKVYFDFHVIEGRPGKIRWERGTLFYRNAYESILYHLVLFKSACKPHTRLKKVPDSFRISPTKIY